MNEIPHAAESRSADSVACNTATENGRITPVAPSSPRRLVRQLPQHQQHVLMWRFGLDGLTLTHAEIASRLGLSANAVKRIEAETLAALGGEFDSKAAA